MRDSISLVDGRLVLETRTVGPRNDPYSRTTVERIRDGRVLWRLTSCALAGDTLEYEGARVAHVPAYDGERGNLASELRAKMDSLTGAEPDFWLERVWGMRDSHKSAEWHEMRELDAQLLRYAE